MPNQSRAISCWLANAQPGMSDAPLVVEEGEAASGEQDVRDQENLLPIANIGRIMKNGVPPNAKISKDAKECVQECVSEFILFITMEANEKCLLEKRKTINGDDLIWAMKNLGFDNYVEPLAIYLNRYKDMCASELTSDGRAPRGKRDAGEMEGAGLSHTLPGLAAQALLGQQPRFAAGGGAEQGFAPQDGGANCGDRGGASGSHAGAYALHGLGAPGMP